MPWSEVEKMAAMGEDGWSGVASASALQGAARRWRTEPRTDQFMDRWLGRADRVVAC